jgi:molybdopterin converting factor small subunit
MPTVRIPTPLRTYTQNRAEVRVSGTTVRELLANLEKECPGIGARLLDDRGVVRRYVNLFLNDEDVRFLKELDTPVGEADQLSIVPAIAGGTGWHAWR